MKTIGIIGNGSFGKLIQKYAEQHCKVHIADKNDSLKNVVQSDVIFLAIPIESYESVLQKIKPNILEDTLIVDVCSVKIESSKMINTVLPKHQNFLISHPMFGPQSAVDSLEGQQLVVCEEKGNAKQFVDKLEKLFKLNVIRKTADEHDKIMAEMHALTFFLSHGLSQSKIKAHSIHAPSYDWLLGLAELDNNHSNELLRTIQTYNPYARSIREQFIQTMIEIHSKFS